MVNDQRSSGGERFRKTAAARGCFAGTLDEFKAAVSEKHGTNKYGRHYQALIDAIEIWFSDGKD